MKHLFLAFLLLLSSLHCLAKSGAEIIRDNCLKSEVAPLLTTQWSQDGGENSQLPMVNGHLAKTGCGATATAQVMKFWSYPEHGFGENYYIWDNPQNERIVRYSNFETSIYDWNNMISKYKNNNAASEIEIDAVSKLMSDLGIALEMKYQDSSTATNIEYISTVLKKYFGYNSSMTIHRYANGAYSMDEWLTMIYKELSEGRPIIMGGAYNGANHIFVADGYDAEGKVHLNLGKASIGSSCNIDGYYDLTVTGQTYNENMRMLIGISPSELPFDIPVYNVTNAGTLKEVLGGELESRKLCMIKLTGHINSIDLQWLKELSAITVGQLSYIDLEDAAIDGNTLLANAFDNCYTLQEIILPNGLTKIETKSFRNCVGLWKVQLPPSLKTIESFAFSNCRYLERVNIPDNITIIGTNPFRYDKFSTFSIDGGNTRFLISNGALLNSQKTKLLSMPTLTTGSYTIEEGVESIEQQAFLKQCMIQDLYLPNTVSQIKSNAFLECISLNHIYVFKNDPPLIETDSFDKNILDRCVIHVPIGSKSLFSNSNWNIFSQIIEDSQCTSVNNIFTDAESDTVTVYDLQGNKITIPSIGNIYIVKKPNGLTTKIILQK